MSDLWSIAGSITAILVYHGMLGIVSMWNLDRWQAIGVSFPVAIASVVPLIFLRRAIRRWRVDYRAAPTADVDRS